MILAGIDIGTNTIRLLIAETGPHTLREIYSDRRITRLGRDLARTGRLSREAEGRSLSVLSDFAGKIKLYSAQHTAAVGTSALRYAEGASNFLDLVKAETGIDVRVITGAEEAGLTLLGVFAALPDMDEPALVIDIGGGSIEIIAAKNGMAMHAVSVELGAVYLTEKFIHSDPPDGAEIEDIRKALRHALADVDRVVEGCRPGVLIGTAGTVTTLAAMDLGISVYDPAKVNNHGLTSRVVDGMVESLSGRGIDERRGMPGLEPGREDIILAGAVVVQEIMYRYGYDQMIVSDWGLREGIVMDLYNKLSMMRKEEGDAEGACTYNG